MNIKSLILTIDYEVFLGGVSGDLYPTLIEPTYRLMKILKNRNLKMTVFWDVMHYHRICTLCDQFPELIVQKKLIENQIKNLVNDGHDIQLHLHPHWLDTDYNNGKWIPSYNRFSLHRLKSLPNRNDINTVVGCILEMKMVIEDLICPIKPDYRVTSFRAGGYLLEPFSKLKNALSELGITIDSSVSIGSHSSVKFYSYDFRGYPRLLKYNFNDTPRNVDNKGIFTEYPIWTIKLPLWYRILKLIRRKVTNQKVSSGFSGKGVQFEVIETNIFQRVKTKLFDKGVIQLTLDSIEKKTFKFMLKRTPNNAVMILHPKMLTNDSFVVLQECIDTHKVKFYSLYDALNL